MDTYLVKSIAVKALKLQKDLDDYNTNIYDEKPDVTKKFVRVFGKEIAAHFLIEYQSAQSLIWAFDDKNLKLFIEHY